MYHVIAVVVVTRLLCDVEVCLLQRRPSHVLLTTLVRCHYGMCIIISNVTFLSQDCPRIVLVFALQRGCTSAGVPRLLDVMVVCMAAPAEALPMHHCLIRLFCRDHAQPLKHRCAVL